MRFFPRLFGRLYWSAKQSNESHQRQGWTYVGYHYAICKDGTIENGRPHWMVGAHAYGDDDHTIGIHLCGNFKIGGPAPAQIESDSLLTGKICEDYGLPVWMLKEKLKMLEKATK